MNPVIRQILELYEAQGHEHYGEDVSQTEHAVQCAAQAKKIGESNELITAALLHDIGHLLESSAPSIGNYKHDALGAEFLAPHFPAAVVEPIRLHAQAKRYLCSTKTDYLQRLSLASVDSLKHQGGLMSPAEQAEFIANPHAEAAITLRYWDDEGKDEGLSGIPISDFQSALEACVLSPLAADPELFRQRGFSVINQGLRADETRALEDSIQALDARAQSILSNVRASGTTLANYYQSTGPELIAVPEFDDPEKICRFEYLAGADETVRERILPRLVEIIKNATGLEVNLFKDKCNAKNPGGGAFQPHQDVIAYDSFKPNFHITVAVFLDAANYKNGCLNFPVNYLSDLCDLDVPMKPTPVGPRPILPSIQGGPHHGSITPEVTEQIRWREVAANVGDVVLFDSYVPHCSYRNTSDQSRRALFFTFNLQEDGTYYEDYYSMKRAEYANPKFHVATPTAHANTEQEARQE